MLRIAVLAVAAAVAVGATLVAQAHRTVELRVTSTANLAHNDLLPAHASFPIEASGRVEEWENRRLLAAEADAAAKAAAAAAKAKAQAARAAAPPPPAVSYPAGSIQDIITKAFTPFGATAVAWGLRVAKCESGYNPRAYNPAGPYYGLFQFLMSTFKATPFGGQDIYDPVANASAAAWKYSQGGAGAWGCK